MYHNRRIAAPTKGISTVSGQTSNWITASPAELAEALEVSLLLSRKPAAVKLFTTNDAFEAWPAAQPETAVFYCGAVHAAGEGQSLKLALTDCGCDTAPRTLGLADGFLDPDFVESYVDSGLYSGMDVAGSLLPEVPTLSGTAGIAVAPLSHFQSVTDADVIILALDPYAAMRVAQAARFLGWPVRAESMGMHGVCAECTAAPHSTGQVCTSLLCSGARHTADWGDTAMSVGIPSHLLAQLVWAIVRTADRYEIDERKERMAVRLSEQGAPMGALAAELRAVRIGTGYFHDTSSAFMPVGQSR